MPIGSDQLKTRFKHHPTRNRDDVFAHEAVRNKCYETALAIDRLCPDSREKSLAMTKLEEAMMWANAAIARDRGAGEVHHGG